MAPQNRRLSSYKSVVIHEFFGNIEGGPFRAPNISNSYFRFPRFWGSGRPRGTFGPSGAPPGPSGAPLNPPESLRGSGGPFRGPGGAPEGPLRGPP
jgi:hypothetical protein